jgi:hypothetical protein
MTDCNNLGLFSSPSQEIVDNFCHSDRFSPQIATICVRSRRQDRRLSTISAILTGLVPRLQQSVFITVTKTRDCQQFLLFRQGLAPRL